MRKAAIDIGSNSVLLLVEEDSGGTWTSVAETSSVTSLGEGAKETGTLSEGGMRRTLSALRDAYETASQLGADSIVAGATMAVRMVRNGGEFIERAKTQGTPVIVLSGEQEAELGFRSVAGDATFSGFPRISIVDVGGQSTEIVTASEGTVMFRRSFAIGTLGLRGGTLASERLGPRELLEATKEIDDAIGLQYLPGRCGEVVALGATGTNLITIREAMSEWDPVRVHGSALRYDEISAEVSRLGAMTDDERASVVGMEAGRERTIHIGALILERFLHALRSDRCRVSVRGWRHALLEEGLPR